MIFFARFKETAETPRRPVFYLIAIKAPTLREAWKQAREREIGYGDEALSVRAIEAP